MTNLLKEKKKKHTNKSSEGRYNIPFNPFHRE